MQRARVTIAAVGALAVLVLAGCVAPDRNAPLPQTQAQIEAALAAKKLQWWDAMFPGTPAPIISVVQTVPPEQVQSRLGDCLAEANLPGVSVDEEGNWSFQGGAINDPAYIALQKQLWVCSAQYPSSIADELIMTGPQLADLYDYYVERYEPCLRTLGIEVLDFPDRDDFVRDTIGYPIWLPYERTVRPIPTSEGWQVIAQRCPLPEVLDTYALPGT